MRRNDRLVETTLGWLALSVLWVIIGIGRIGHHNQSGWLLVATPVAVLVIYLWRVSKP